MKLLVTAFGPFDGRPENASSLAVRGLRTVFPQIHTRTLPVDAVIAPARLRQALRLLKPDVLLMLGEAVGSRQIRLEAYAWNELDFKIPDLAGRQPTARPIHSGAPPMLASTLPLDRLHGRLAAAGHEVGFSEDPGRYLCNQLFFTALDYLKTSEMVCSAGFIHLPLARDLPTDQAVDALACVLGEWL